MANMARLQATVAAVMGSTLVAGIQFEGAVLGLAEGAGMFTEVIYQECDNGGAPTRMFC